jgi:hypothetical protein
MVLEPQVLAEGKARGSEKADRFIKPVLVLPTYAFFRTSIHRFLNTFFRAAFGQDNFGFFLFLVESENFRAELHTTFAADTFIGVDIYKPVHIETSSHFSLQSFT